MESTMTPPASALVASWYICLVLAAPLIVLRLRSRWKRHEQLGVDDFVFIAAILLVLAFNAIIVYMWSKGLADWETGNQIPEAWVIAMMQMLLPSKILYPSAAWAIKFSVVLFYRIAAPLDSRVVMMCYVVLCYLIVSWGGLFCFTLFGCRPWDKYWSGDPSHECSVEFIVLSWWLLTFLNISTNIIVVALPITTIKIFYMRPRDIVAIGFMFFLGLIVIAASSMQAYYNRQPSIMLAATASMVELSIGLIATSLLALSKTFLGENAFQVSTSPRLSLALAPSQSQAQLNEMSPLEEAEKAEKIEKDAPVKRSLSLSAIKRSLSMRGARANGPPASSLHSRNRLSIASKDSSVLPGQFHIGFLMDETKEYGNDARAEEGIGRITVCADINDLHRKSQMELKSPGLESWFERWL